MSRATDGARELYVTGVGGLAFLAGLLPLINWLNSIIGLMFWIASVLGALFLIIARRRQGSSALFALLELGVIGVLVFGTIYGVMWYFMVYMPANPSMFEWKLAAPTVHP